MGLTFLPFAAIFRPGLIEVAKAHIRQHEEADEDDNATPKLPKSTSSASCVEFGEGKKWRLHFCARDEMPDLRGLYQRLPSPRDSLPCIYRRFFPGLFTI